MMVEFHHLLFVVKFSRWLHVPTLSLSLFPWANIVLETAVASFFTPISQKPPEKTLWHERAPDDDTPSTLLVGRYEPDNKERQLAPRQPRRKVAAFDFVSNGSGYDHLVCAYGLLHRIQHSFKQVRGKGIHQMPKTGDGGMHQFLSY
jgi:hypothetical protein